MTLSGLIACSTRSPVAKKSFGAIALGATFNPKIYVGDSAWLLSTLDRSECGSRVPEIALITNHRP